MKQILFISPSKQMAERAEKIIRERNLPVDLKIGAMETAKEIAEKAISQGAKVILSRGGTASFLKKNLPVPCINVKFTSGCYVEAFEKIREANGTVAFFSVEEISDSVRTLCHLMTIQADFYRFQDEETAEVAVCQAVRSGNVFGVGGAVTGKYADIYSLPYFTLENTKEDIEVALEAAQLTLFSLLREEEKRKTLQLQLQQYEAIFNYTHDGIIAVDKTGHVVIANKQAEIILPLQDKPFEGKHIEKILPETKLPDVMRSGQAEIDELMKVGNTIINTNRIPIILDGHVEGIVATFRDIESIQISEQKIRSNLHRKGMTSKYRFSDIIGDSPAQKKAIRIAKSYAKNNSNMLIIGEIGTGKEMLAHAVHKGSNRKNAPFVTLNLAGVSANMLLTDLQGYENDANPFGVKGKKAGIFELAHGGTIFLDKIEDAPLEVQTFLLRVLDNKEVRRIGGEHMIPIDVRVISSATSGLLAKIQDGKFLEELYYLLSVLTLEVPPLRERGDDYLLLCNEWFHRSFGMEFRKYEDKIKLIEKYVSEYEWKGNIRQLSNFVERVSVLLKNDVSIEDIISTLPDARRRHMESQQHVTLGKWTKSAVIDALSASSLNISKAARMLHCSRSTLYKKMEEFNIKITNIKKGGS